MSFVRAFGRFWYDFIIGDDWKIAAAVTTALAVGAAIASTVDPIPEWFAPVIGAAVVVAFTISLIVDVRRSS